jgi:hypothetical protein
MTEKKQTKTNPPIDPKGMRKATAWWNRSTGEYRLSNGRVVRMTWLATDGPLGPRGRQSTRVNIVAWEVNTNDPAPMQTLENVFRFRAAKPSEEILTRRVPTDAAGGQHHGPSITHRRANRRTGSIDARWRGPRLARLHRGPLRNGARRTSSSRRSGVTTPMNGLGAGE